MSKIDLMESEENPNYEAEQEEQAKLKAEFDAQELEKKIEEAKQFLVMHGFTVSRYDF